MPSGMVGPWAGAAQRADPGAGAGAWQGAGYIPGSTAGQPLRLWLLNLRTALTLQSMSVAVRDYPAGRRVGGRGSGVRGEAPMGDRHGGRQRDAGWDQGGGSPRGPHQSVNCRPRARRTVAKVRGRMVESGLSPRPCFWSGVSRPPGTLFPELLPPPTPRPPAVPGAGHQMSKQGRPDGPWHTWSTRSNLERGSHVLKAHFPGGVKGKHTD